MSGLDSVQANLPKVFGQDKNKVLAQNAPSKKPSQPRVKTTETQREESVSWTPSREQWLWGAGIAFTALGAGLGLRVGVRHMRAKTALKNEQRFQVTREEWLLTKPSTKHTKHVWIDMYEKDGKFYEHDLTTPKRSWFLGEQKFADKPDGEWRFRIQTVPTELRGKSPKTFRVASIVDNYHAKDLIDRKGNPTTHAQEMLPLMVDGLEDKVGVLGINRTDTNGKGFSIYSHAALRYLTQIKQDKSHPWEPFLSHVNCSFGGDLDYTWISDKLGQSITPLNVHLYRNDIFPLLHPDSQASITALQDLAQAGGTISQAAGNERHHAFVLEQLAQVPSNSPGNIYIVGSKNKRGNIDIWDNKEGSSETRFVNAHAFGPDTSEATVRMTNDRLREALGEPENPASLIDFLPGKPEAIMPKQ